MEHVVNLLQHLILWMPCHPRLRNFGICDFCTHVQFLCYSEVRLRMLGNYAQLSLVNMLRFALRVLRLAFLNL